jgi:hypothetical protein
MFGTLTDFFIGYAVCLLFPIPYVNSTIIAVYNWVWAKLFPVAVAAPAVVAPVATPAATAAKAPTPPAA